MYGYIYITYNKINGKIYIGQRKGEYDKSYYGSGKYLKRAIEKYGVENFENRIIQWCKTKEELNEKEKYWIAKYNCNARNKFGYNIASGGSNGNIYEYMTDERKLEVKLKISNSLKGNTRSKGKVRSEKTKQNISNSLKGNKHLLGHKHSSETIEKMKENNKGENNPMYGKKHSEETRRKISEAIKAKNLKKKNGVK